MLLFLIAWLVKEVAMRITTLVPTTALSCAIQEWVPGGHRCAEADGLHVCISWQPRCSDLASYRPAVFGEFLSSGHFGIAG